MELLTLLFLITISFTASLAQEVRWLSFEEVQKKMSSDPKPVVVFIHTDWCKYCAMQESNTFTNSSVIQNLTSDFYAIRLNAEEKSEITFLNRKYSYPAAGSGYHQLAELLGKDNGEVIFPTTLILSKTFLIIDRTTGFVSSSELLKKMKAIQIDN